MRWNLANPLNPSSPLRSKRVQGAVGVLVVAAAAVLGYDLEPAWVEGKVQNFELLLAQLSTVWGLLGTILASRSPRPF